MRRVNGRGLKIWRPDALEACGIRQREAEADVEGLSAAPPTPRWIQIPGKKITSRHKDREGVHFTFPFMEIHPIELLPQSGIIYI